MRAACSVTCRARTAVHGLSARRSLATRAGAVDSSGGQPAPAVAAPTRRLPPPPPSLAYLIRTGRLSNAAHAVWTALLGDRPSTAPPPFAVDATAGLGGDTVGLARALGPAGRVLALDVSEAAIAGTAAALTAAEASGTPLAPVRLVRACHSTLGELLGGQRVDLIAFNLGYLPAPGAAGVEAAGGPCTEIATTVAALKAATDALAPGGAVTVASYVGHAGGPEEAAAVSVFLEALDPDTFVVCETRLSNRPRAPRLAVVYKKQ